MSIVAQILTLEAQGKLVSLESLLTGQETVRTLWLSQEVLAAVTPPFAGPRSIQLSEFREFLDSFLEGCEMSVAEDPYCKPAHAMMARIDPIADDFWDFRITSPRPGIRAFGGFADFDSFVVLTWQFREDISDFGAEVADCKSEWARLFGMTPPMKKRHLNDYLSNYFAV